MPNGEIQYAPVPMPEFRPTKVRIAFALALVLMSAATLLYLCDLSRVDESGNLGLHTNAVLERLDDVLVSFRDSIGASRGLDADSDRMLEESISSMLSAIKDVRQLTSDNPGQQQRIGPLQGTVDRVIALERQRLDIAHRDVNEGNTFYRAGGGYELDNQIRAAIMGMRDEERSLLSRRTQQVRRRTRTAAWMLLVCGLLGLGTLLAVYFHLEREIGRREHS